MIAGCGDSVPPRMMDDVTRRLLAGKAMFVTDEEGHATAAWLGYVKVYPRSSPPISDSTLADLIALPKLTALYVNNENITDAGMQHLARMTQLDVLDLRRSSITDRGLQQLESLKRLKVLCLAETQVTDAGVDRFRRAVPGCDLRR
ncbi:MAG TPA: hypothetical protein VG125_07915 [Pirellulales bacterium]|jgi:hypothetical protein|nr:hypothetical protein [Pirellulales bacterium]